MRSCEPTREERPAADAAHLGLPAIRFDGQGHASMPDDDTLREARMRSDADQVQHESRRRMTRREFVEGAAAGSLGIAAGTARSRACGAGDDGRAEEQDLIRRGAAAALEKSLRPALRERAYPGHFTVTADGVHFGAENTWPGLDAWEMAGAYLLAGHTRAVLDSFDFIQASQRHDGNIPFAIFPGDERPAGLDTHLRGLKFPEDVYAYKPVVRPGQPDHATMGVRKWIGLFTHWQIRANPLSVLGPISYILTAHDIFAATQSADWLAEKSASLEATGAHLASRISGNGLMGGAGFYVESPPRNQWDGVTQCYGIQAFRHLGDLLGALGRRERQAAWHRQADALRGRFSEVFWRQDHFAEYVHPERGVVDHHGLSDVNWAAIGLGVATDQQIRALWPILTQEPAWWRGDMPTHLVTKPSAYEPWEMSEPLPFEHAAPTYDVAAMGRVWHLEVLACRRLGEAQRLRESVARVCRMGQRHDWLWHDRYHAGPDDTVKPGAVNGYCEYAAVLVRAVLGNPDVFPELEPK